MLKYNWIIVMRSIKLFMVLVLLFINVNGFAQRYDLNQLLDSALQNNYLLKSTEKNKLIKQSELEILQTDYLPKVSASASFSYWKFLLPNKQKLLGDALSDMYTDVMFYQPIYDFGQTKAKKSIVEEEILLNDLIITQMRQTIIWGVANAYFEVLISESEIAVHESALKQLKQHLRYAESLYDIGKGSSIDVLKIKVQLSVEEKKMQQSKNSLISKKIDLLKLCNFGKTEEINIQDKSKQWFELNQIVSKRILSLDSLKINHPSLITFDIKTEIEKKTIDLTSLQNRPELFSYGIGSWEHGYIPFGNNFNYNVGIGIRYTLPYWGNSGYKYKINQSEIVIEQYDNQKQDVYLELKKEIDLSLNTLDEIKKTIISNKEIIELANETINSASIKYQAGQGNIIDILDAQQILTEAQLEYEKSIIEYLQILAKLNYLRGNDKYPF